MAFLLQVTLVAPRRLSAASTFRPTPVVSATIAAVHRRADIAAPETAKSDPNRDLGMPVEAGAEGKDNGFGGAGGPGWGGRRGCC